MQCNHCSYPDSRVVETKRDERTNKVVRRRECIKCGVRFTTQENIRANPTGYETPPPRRILEK